MCGGRAIKRGVQKEEGKEVLMEEEVGEVSIRMIADGGDGGGGSKL